MSNDDPIAVTLQVTDILEQMAVSYAIGGSLASAVHGVMRATMDADLVADMRLEHVQPFVAQVSDRQWRDIVGVLKVQGEQLDRAYLQQMAQELRVTDILVRALDEIA